MIYRLEDRVLFEAAAAVEAAYADEAQNQTDNAEQTEGAEQSEAEKYAAAAGPGPDNNADSSSAASCPISVLSYPSARSSSSRSIWSPPI